jgi:RNA polymerase sigma factor (sigma-70 family)
MATTRIEDLEDLIENVITKIYVKYKSLQIDNILGYVYRMLENELKDHWKKKHREKNVYSPEDVYSQESYESDLSIEETIVNQDLIINLKKVIHNFRSPKKKKIFELKLKGYESKEIMQEMNMSRSAYDTIVYRATQEIKDAFKNYRMM